eukprot:CAMPEP_0171232486 /NCGR_PEP_ID=MMETSP0790-20130122/40433_1 /TAXON_ID=2925 /ORGANISM="Alexandrium catenella, Strain OF101" /LENGTH=136 /DNA_ID=CAMNT_0011698723 /DNA_START=87 /DNA_END=493 /DNA_ORIENTATION=+
MISETAYTQFPGPIYYDKGEGAVNGPHGADKGVVMPSSNDPMLSMYSGAFKANPSSVQGLLEGRKDPTKVAVANFQAAAQQEGEGLARSLRVARPAGNRATPLAPPLQRLGAPDPGRSEQGAPAGGVALGSSAVLW